MPIYILYGIITTVPLRSHGHPHIKRYPDRIITLVRRPIGNDKGTGCAVPLLCDIHNGITALAWFCVRYEQPLVVPQSSQTWQAPFCFTRIEPQLPHCSPVYPCALAVITFF